MATKRRITIYFPEPEQNELWEAIERLPKGARNLILRDVIKQALLGSSSKVNTLLQGIIEAPGAKEPETVAADKEVMFKIPLFKKG